MSSLSINIRGTKNPNTIPYLTNLYDKCSVSYKGDLGLDLFLPEDMIIAPKSTTFIDLGIGVQFDTVDGTRRGYTLCPRSSISKTKIRLANSIGIIDAGYNGNIIAAVDNVSDDEICLKQGERYFQLVFFTFDTPAVVKLCDGLSSTDRGSNGFGSSGK